MIQISLNSEIVGFMPVLHLYGITLPLNKAPWKPIQGGQLICKNDFQVRAYSRRAHSKAGAYSIIYGMPQFHPHASHRHISFSKYA